MSENELPMMLTVPELAAFLRIGTSTAYSLIRKKAIPSVRFGRQIRIYKQDVIDLLHVDHA